MTPTRVVEFWLGPAPDDVESVTLASKRWYVTDDGFDAEVRDRFGAAIEQARRGVFADWADTPEGALALVILLDQFPRNAYRGTADAFACDAVALAVAERALERVSTAGSPVRDGRSCTIPSSTARIRRIRSAPWRSSKPSRQ